ncbi:MAG: hypothetical protein ABSH08_07425 [Tepidisphaeraceae bacterium]|jgi:hypothetical protein
MKLNILPHTTDRAVVDHTIGTGDRRHRLHLRLVPVCRCWIADRIRQSQWWVARSESGSRRIDVAEFIEFCIGCGVAPLAALIELMKLRR